MQVPHLGRGLEPWYCLCRGRKRPPRNLWKDHPHRVWRGEDWNVGDALIKWPVLTGRFQIVEQPQENGGAFSCTPLPRGKCLFPESHNGTDLSSTLHQSFANETVRFSRFTFNAKMFIECLLQQVQCPVLQMTASASHLADESCAEIQVNQVDTSYCNMGNRPPSWPTVALAVKDLVIFLNPIKSKQPSAWFPFWFWKDKTPRRTVISRRGDLTWSSEDMESLAEDVHQASTPKKQRLSRMSSQEEMMVQPKPDNSGGETWKCVAPLCPLRWVFTGVVFQLWSARQNVGATPCAWATLTRPSSSGGKQWIRPTARTPCGSSS